MRRAHLLWLPLVAGIALAGTATAQGLQPPFGVRAPDAGGKAHGGKTYACAPLTAPVVTFAPPSKYGSAGAARDTDDAQAEAAFAEVMAPVRELSSTVVKAANAYMRTGAREAAACAGRHLAHWAQADALGRPESHTGFYKLATTLSGVSLAYLQIAPALDADSRRIISAWLTTRGWQVARYFETLSLPRASRNNHRAWAGLAAASAAVAAQDRALFAKGVESFSLVACQATPDGALPLELSRGRKASEYHLYALTALVPLAELAERNGTAAYSLCQGALHRTVAFSLAALRDPAPITALAGQPQEAAATLAKPSRIAFLEPYLARFPDKIGLAGQWLDRRPLGLTDLGGNQTLLYGTASR